MAVLVGLLAGAFFLLGAAVARCVRDRKLMEDYSVAVAFGALVCVTAIDLAPEAIEIAEELGWPLVLVLVVAGVVTLVLLDRALPHKHGEGGGGNVAHLGGMALVAIVVHNLTEGAAIYAISVQDLSAGIAFAVGVGMHNAPMGMLLYSAVEQDRARGLVALVAAVLSPFVGSLLMLVLGNVISDAVLDGVVCVALGMIAYILLIELLPTMIRGGNAKRSLIGAAAGAAFVFAGSLLV